MTSAKRLSGTVPTLAGSIGRLTALTRRNHTSLTATPKALAHGMRQRTDLRATDAHPGDTPRIIARPGGHQEARPTPIDDMVLCA